MGDNGGLGHSRSSRVRSNWAGYILKTKPTRLTGVLERGVKDDFIAESLSNWKNRVPLD